MNVSPLTHDQLKQQLFEDDPELKQAYDDMEPAHQLVELRIQKGLTQRQLADLINSSQSSIARLESGNGSKHGSLLQRAARALGYRICFVPLEETERKHKQEVA